MTTASERREKERRERPSEAETKRYLEIIEEKVKPKPCPECGGVMSYNISKYAPYVRVRMCGDCAYEVLGASE